MANILFHIGHHKTGTSWLQSNYFQHKDSFNLLNDYTHPWNDKLCRLIIKSDNFILEECMEIFHNRLLKDRVNVLSAERLSGHPISGGFDAEEIAQRLKQISPTAKILITTRNPSSFIVSVYKQMISEGYCGTLKDFLCTAHWKNCGVNKSYFLQEKIVRTYTNKFGKENVLTLEFEQFVESQKDFLDQIQEFLNLPKISLDSNTLNERVNKTPGIRRIKAIRFFNRFRKSELNPFPFFCIGDNVRLILIYATSIFFTKKKLIDRNMIKEYLK